LHNLATGAATKASYGTGDLLSADADASDAASVLRGDTSAFERIVRRWQGPLVTLAYRFCRNHHRAEEMAQEAFLKAYRGLSSWRGTTPFPRWLFALAANHYRSRMRKFEPESIEWEERATVGSRSSPEADVERREVESAVHHAVAALPPKYRDIVILYYFRSSDLSETAASLGLREGTAKARLHRARLLLQNRLKKIVA
jgi:RNA polymerase sigma-70 factor (ECF subfamily)